MNHRAVKVTVFSLILLAAVAILFSLVFSVAVTKETRLVGASELLMVAIYDDRPIAEIKALLEAHPEWAREPIYEDWFAVHCAGQAGRPDILQLLLDFGADINERGGPGNANVIVSAFESNDPQTLAFVLDNGADPHARMSDGATPLEYIRKYGSVELQKVLDDRGLPAKSP